MHKQALLIGLMVFALASAAQARDSIVRVPLADVLAMPESVGKLDGSIRFFLAGQATPKLAKSLATGVVNEKTDGTLKSDEFGCKWATLSALMSMQQEAKNLGANAVVNIVSYYKKNETRDATTVECHAGTIVIGVALKGTYAKIAE